MYFDSNDEMYFEDEIIALQLHGGRNNSRFSILKNASPNRKGAKTVSFFED